MVLLQLLVCALPLTRALPTINSTLHIIGSQPIECTNEHTSPVIPQDCSDLVTALQDIPGYSKSIDYGPTQPEPGTTPKMFGYHTCLFMIEKRNHMPQHVQDNFRLADYAYLLRLIATQCTTQRPGGRISIGDRRYFFAYLGGAPMERKVLGAGSTSSVEVIPGMI